jgi:hypothetical protein
MPEGERKSHIPPWAERERLSDMAWIGENLHVFWPAAQAAYEEEGRGAIVADTTVRPTGEGHPFGYFSQQLVIAFGDRDAIRMVAAYDPEWQFVAMLLKPSNRVSTYRIGVPGPR